MTRHGIECARLESLQDVGACDADAGQTQVRDGDGTGWMGAQVPDSLWLQSSSPCTACRAFMLLRSPESGKAGGKLREWAEAKAKEGSATCACASGSPARSAASWPGRCAGPRASAARGRRGRSRPCSLARGKNVAGVARLRAATGLGWQVAIGRARPGGEKGPRRPVGMCRPRDSVRCPEAPAKCSPGLTAPSTLTSNAAQRSPPHLSVRQVAPVSTVLAWHRALVSSCAPASPCARTHAACVQLCMWRSSPNSSPSRLLVGTVGDSGSATQTCARAMHMPTPHARSQSACAFLAWARITT